MTSMNQNSAPPLTWLFNFDHFITTGLIKIIFIVGTVLILLGGVGGGGLTALSSLAVGVSTRSFTAMLAGIFILILSLIGAALGILVLRVYCELIMVIFKINDNVQILRDRG